MRTATATTTKTAPRTKLSAKAKRPVKAAKPDAASLASKDAKRAIPKAPEGKGVVVLKTICAELGINPKVARRELRKHRAESIEEKSRDALRSHDLHTRWVFRKGDPQIPRIKEILRAYVERNGESE